MDSSHTEAENGDESTNSTQTDARPGEQCCGQIPEGSFSGQAKHKDGGFLGKRALICVCFRGFISF